MAGQIRSLKTALATGLSGSLNWPGSGGGDVASAGSVKPGTARAFYSLQSDYSTQVSSTTVGDTSPATAFSPPAPLFIASDTSRVFGQTWVSSVTSTSGSTATTFNFSGGTTWLGGASVVESALTPSQKLVVFNSITTASVLDVEGRFGQGSSDTTLVSVTLPAASRFIASSVWIEASQGTQMVQGMTSTLQAFSGSTFTFLLSVLSRNNLYGGVPSQTTAHLLVMSTGTVAQ